MKVLLIAILSLSFFQLYSQIVFDLPKNEKKATANKVFASFHVNIGFINPVDVNTYINDEINRIAPGGAFLLQGTTNISVACSFNFALLYRPAGNFQFSFPIEYGFAPKTIVIDNSTLKFSMNRFSLGPMITYRFFHQNENALYGGIALLYHNMWFEEFSANALGPRFEFGFTRFRFQSDFEFFINIDIANGQTRENSGSVNSINFTGFYFGTRIII